MKLPSKLRMSQHQVTTYVHQPTTWCASARSRGSRQGKTPKFHSRRSLPLSEKFQSPPKISHLFAVLCVCGVVWCVWCGVCVCMFGSPLKEGGKVQSDMFSLILVNGKRAQPVMGLG